MLTGTLLSSIRCYVNAYSFFLQYVTVLMLTLLSSIRYCVNAYSSFFNMLFTVLMLTLLSSICYCVNAYFSCFNMLKGQCHKFFYLFFSFKILYLGPYRIFNDCEDMYSTWTVLKLNYVLLLPFVI